MALRASGEASGQDFDLKAVIGQGEGGVPDGAILIAFAEAVLGDDEAALAAAREDVTAALGEAALVDAAGIVATFNAIDRVADASGTPLDEARIEASADLRAELDLDAFLTLA